ncbi:HlyC/CorC family transporter [Futiania mangrovi]|uniref:HlyC/CorC family transporter n=1 Tax=Futiania mangrovi TaxID=2959716 RepID=A0A9J6PCX8_9PROT|nr:HlyC/CorC family transporter [Futiania mangrovii]MCP1336158.1 HlyC/CorC family transporter [Futiania mangrovii]
MDLTLILFLGAIVALLVLSGFFSGSETALTAVSRARMHALEKQGDHAARRVLHLTEDKERLIGAILLGNNLVNILASALATSLFLKLFGDAGVAYATLVMTALVVIFAEVLPKTFAIAFPNKVARVVATPIMVIVALFTPVSAAVQAIVSRVLGLFNVRTEEEHIPVHEEIKGTIDYHHAEGAVVKDERDRFGGLLNLRTLEVSEVMVHRKSMVMLNADLPPDQLVRKIVRSPFTRIPVWRDNPENIIGVIHAKDVLRALSSGEVTMETLDISRIARQPWFVPDTTSLAEQLDAFLNRRQHFALVVDEYGALQGLITLEDILEEIVGEITDEHDVEVAGVEQQPDGSFIVDGTVAIRDLNRSLDWSLPDDEATTAAGLVIHEARAIPEKGQTFTFYGYRFQVLERQRNQITLLRITPLRNRDRATPR